MDDRNSFSGRFRRYAKVGTSVGGLAARLASNRYLGTGLDRGRHAADLKAALGDLKGPLMKAVQLLATIPDALPPEYVTELSQLQSNAPPMGWPFVRRRMQAELGPRWQERFSEFEREATAAASLGQVHRAVTSGGRKVACKLQYPDMLSAVEADLNQLRFAFGVFERTDPALRTGEAYRELAARLKEELDYRREAANIRLYAHMLGAEPHVRLPEVVEDLSTDRLLTMTWLEGRPLLDYKEADHETRRIISEHMFRTWYVPLYRYGIIHGDPHLGNYTVRPDDLGINLLDFGCIRIFPPRFVRGSIDLYRALRDDDEELAVEAYRNWGFRDIGRETIAILNDWASFIYGPLMEPGARRIQMGDTPGAYGRERAARVHQALREVGGITIPREFVLMDRAAVGLGSVFLHMNAEVDWHALFHELAGDFEVDALARRQGEALAAAGLEIPAENG